MINDVLAKIRDKLNDYFKVITSSDTNQVTFLDGLKMDPLSFPPNSVVPVLINVEEEKIIRQANRYEGVVKNGLKTELAPSLGINMFVLFVSNFSDYEQSLLFLSLLISYFQRNPVLDHYNTPTLSDSVDKVIIELITLPIAQRNELWNSLRTIYLPSAVYKIGVLVYRDDTSVKIESKVAFVEIKTNVQ